MNTWDTDVDLPVILATADTTVIETTGMYTETLIAIVRRAVGMRGIVIASEGTVETGESAGVRRRSEEAAEDIHLNIVAEEATPGAHQGEKALVATGNRTVRVVPVFPQRIVQIRVGEVDPTVGDGKPLLVQRPQVILINMHARPQDQR